MNLIMLAGRLGKDPEIKYFENGKVLAQVSIGITRYQGKDKEKTTDWFDLKAWGKTAELIAEKYRKGDVLCVQGNVEQEKWESEGQKRSKLVVKVDQVIFLPGVGSKPAEEDF